MSNDKAFARSWTRVGGICGLAGIAAYLLAAFAPLPDVAGYFAAFAFGPLLAVSFVGLSHTLNPNGKSVITQIAAVFGIAAGVTVLIMLTTQQAIFALMRSTPGTAENALADPYRTIERGLNSVHYGIDVAWDVLISTSVILFGVAMARSRLFGRIFGAVGIALGVLLLGFNLWYFPTPPASAHSIDWGPLVALWMLVTFVLMLRYGFRKQRSTPTPDQEN